MGIQPFPDVLGAPSGSPQTSKRYRTATYLPLQQPNQLQTPPASDSGSPRVKVERVWSESQGGITLTSFHHLNSPVTLPSLGEFDQGVEDLIRKHGPARPQTPPSPLPALTLSPTVPQPPKSITDTQSLSPSPYDSYCLDASFSAHGVISFITFGTSIPPLHAHMGMDFYPSPHPEGENRHINQKYTTEQGDFIIYAWHDKKMKWQHIKQEFGARFGRTPERTVQGLQAWYYRMNQRIPLWDQDGWLCFDNEDDLESRHVAIKCRERESQDKPVEPLGLGQRYPERAVNYDWVDPEFKIKARDWANKRALQHRERQERRRRKEQQRLKL